MSRAEIVIHQDGSFAVKGYLPPPPETGKITLGASLKNFVRRLKELELVHQELLADDGKLIGQERYQLIEVMDRALAELVQLRSLLEDGARNDGFSAFHTRFDYKLRLKIVGQRYEGQGVLGIFRRLKINRFNVWLSRLIQERLLNIVKFFGQALADGRLSDSERIILNRSLDRLLFGVILARDHLKRGELN